MTTRGVRTLLVATLLAGPACSQSVDYEPPPTPVRVEVVGLSGERVEGVRYSATIEPNSRVDLAFKVGGYVREIATRSSADGRARPLQDSDVVAADDVLARLDQGDYQQKVLQARSQLAEAEAGLALARQDLERARALFEARSLTRPDLDAAETQVTVLTAKVSGARALVQEAENALGETDLRSPIAGVVLARLVEVGSLVGPGSGAFVLADTSRVKVVFGAPDRMAQRLRLGSSIDVETEALPGERFVGRITRIASAADLRSRVFDIELSIPNPDRRLKPGMIAALQVDEPQTAPDTSALLVVPLSAIVRSASNPDGYAVFVVEDREGAALARLRDVTLGAAIGNRMAVTSGLRAGERIIVTGAAMVVDGQAVRPIS